LCYAGPVEKGLEAVATLKDFEPPAVDMLGQMPYTAFQRLPDPLNPPGPMNYWKAHYLKIFDDEAIDSIINHAANLPSPLSEIHIEHMGGAVKRLSEEETAFGNREAEFALNIVGKWTNPAESAKNTVWVRGFWQYMARFSTGATYVNYLSDTREEMVRASYSTKYQKLVSLKQKYDPANLFRFNHNFAVYK
jgi:hypothetical protein